MGRTTQTKRAFQEDGFLKTHIGGQALLEGIMMRGKYNWACGIRRPNGELYVEEHPISKKARPGWFSWPVVRGCVAFVDSLVLGAKALEIAANQALLEEDEPEPRAVLSPAQYAAAAPSSRSVATGKSVVPAASASLNAVLPSASVPGTVQVQPEFSTATVQPVSNSQPAFAIASVQSTAEEEFSSVATTVAVVLGLILGVVLFVVVPAFVADGIASGAARDSLVWNTVDGVARVVIFIFYIWLIGRMKDIKRMFSYHGAEHKTIHCYEHGLELTCENARTFPRLHVRCGTAFLVMVMIIAIVVYAVIPLEGLLQACGLSGAVLFAAVLALRIALLPFIAGISYEITVKWAGSHPENKLVRIVLWPGLQMQRLTTREPDDGMLECAIAAMDRVLAYEAAYEREQA